MRNNIRRSGVSFNWALSYRGLIEEDPLLIEDRRESSTVIGARIFLFNIRMDNFQPN